MLSVSSLTTAPQRPAAFRLRPWHWATALCCLTYFVGLGAYPLLDPDEGRYAEIPREMLETGNWVIPTLNYVPYLEKPPLIYWITAGFMGAFGEAEWVVRIVPALLGLLGLAVVWWLARLTVGRETARWTPGVLATMALYFALARVPLTDMLISVTLAASLTAWWSAEQKTGGRRLAMLAVSGLLLGLAVLSKGLVAIILFGAVGVITLAFGRRLGTLLSAVVWPVLVSIAVNLPWWLAAQARDPQFAHFYFIVQHLDRFLGHDFNEHRRPAGYYIPIVILGCSLWSVFWPQMLRGKLQAWRTLEPGEKATPVFLCVWALAVIGFFSASSSQLATYVLPAWWPLAVCTSACVRSIMGETTLARSTRWSLGFIAAALVLVAVAGVVLPGDKPEFSGPAVHFAQVALASVGLIAAAGLLTLHRIRTPDLRMGVLIALAALVLCSFVPATTAIARNRDAGALIPAPLRPMPTGSGWTLAQYKCYEQSLNYYTHARIVLIGWESELTMGPDQPDAAEWFPRDDGAVSRLSARGPLALVVWPQHADDLCRRFGLTIWTEGYKRKLLVNKSGLDWLRAHGAMPPAPKR